MSNAIIRAGLFPFAGAMKPSELEQLKEIFFAAIEKPAEQRPQFLGQACGGDEDLRAEVTRLLAQHDRAGGFLESPFADILSLRNLADSQILENNRMIAGRYRIVSLLGEGGMGVVYKAEDTRLPRFIALKSLGKAVAGDTASLERLRREAQAASTLNHPNICTIHDVVESEGQTFIVMEYLDGQTLKEMIRGNDSSAEADWSENTPTSVKNLLEIAAQIIQGLEAAHNKGIVHRDIKPANIFVTKTGHVKILDFGIAKITRGLSDAVASGEAQSPGTLGIVTTATVPAGTAAYMSPEQVGAKELDTRTDLFSLGAVLYEMATGMAPFRGATTNLVLDSVLNQGVVPAMQLNPNIPSELSNLIDKCLQKDRDLRYQSAADLRSELDRLENQINLIRGPDLDGAAVPASTRKEPHSRRQENLEQEVPVRHLTTRGGIFIIACGIAALGILVLLFRPTVPAPRITGSIQVTHDGRDKERLVTDGRRIYFSSYPNVNPRIFQVPVTGGDTVNFETSVSGPYVFDISPDRSELLVGSCYWGRATSACPLWIQPTVGGAPRRLGNISASDAGWSPDGKHVAYVTENSLYRVGTTGEGLQKVISMPVGDELSWPRWSSDGTRLRFSVATQSNGTSLWEVSADGQGLHPFLPKWNTPPSECCGSWTRNGRYFLFQSDRGGSTNVWAIRESTSLFQKSSDQPVQLTAGPTSAGTAVPSVNGTRLFVTTARSGELMRYDFATQDFAPYFSGISAIGMTFSRDGKWVTYVAYPQHTLWRSKADGSERLQLTYPPMYVLQPRWSPDGKRIAFMAMQGDKPWSIFVISADGGNLEQPVPGDRLGFDPSWSPDGNRLLFGRHPTTQGPGSGTLDLEIVDLRSHAVAKIPGSDELWSPRWSPDGRYILAVPRDADRLMLFDIQNQKWTELAKIPAGYPEWSRDAQYIYCLAKPKGIPSRAILRVRLRDHKVEQVASLSNFKQPTVDWGDWAGLGPDDSPILLREAGTPEIFALDWDAP